jgi:integrase
VVKRANTRREQDGRMLLPARVTPRTLRRTWAMLALTAGRDVRWGDGADGAHRRA